MMTHVVSDRDPKTILVMYHALLETTLWLGLSRNMGCWYIGWPGSCCMTCGCAIFVTRPAVLSTLDGP